MRTLVLFANARDAKAVFGTLRTAGKAYQLQMRHVAPNGDEMQFGFGTDFTELRGRFAGTQWDDVSWRWNAPEELKAYFATLTRSVAIA